MSFFLNYQNVNSLQDFLVLKQEPVKLLHTLLKKKRTKSDEGPGFKQLNTGFSLDCKTLENGKAFLGPGKVGEFQTNVITVRNEVAKVMFLQVSVCP